MTAFQAKFIKCAVAGVLACGIQSAIAADENTSAENAGNSAARLDFLDKYAGRVKYLDAVITVIGNVVLAGVHEYVGGLVESSRRGPVAADRKQVAAIVGKRMQVVFLEDRDAFRAHVNGARAFDGIGKTAYFPGGHFHGPGP